MFQEKDFEDIISIYPELIEDGLTLIGRQVTIYGRRMDLLFEDKFKRKLIIELKIGSIKDIHIGQVLSYEGILLSAEDPTIRVMLVGNRVPPNIQRSLDYHGIAWKEITLTKLKEFLENRKDESFLKVIEIEEPLGGNSAHAKPVGHFNNHTTFERASGVLNLNGITNDWIGLNQSRYSLDQIFKAQKAVDIVKRTAFSFHNELIQQLNQRNLRWSARTHIRGITYFCTSNKAFLAYNINQEYISIKFFTGNSNIEGLRKGTWVNKDDKLSSEPFRIVDNESIKQAVNFAMKAYEISVNWPG
jgi:hypothetical protein